MLCKRSRVVSRKPKLLVTWNGASSEPEVSYKRSRGAVTLGAPAVPRVVSAVLAAASYSTLNRNALDRPEKPDENDQTDGVPVVSPFLQAGCTGAPVRHRRLG